MRALILAAGYGTRLGKVTEDTPKALVKLGENPILDLNIRKLLAAGVSKILVNTHYLAEQVEDFLDKQPYQELVATVFEPSLLGTAGTVSANWEFFNDSDFIVMHGDNFFEAELDSFLVTHMNRKVGTIVTMATFDTNTPELCGTVVTDDEGVVVDFFEKRAESPSRRANAAIYLVSEEAKSYFDNVSLSESDISLDIIPKLLGKIQEHFLPGAFFDIGSPAGLSQAAASHRRISSTP